MSERKLEFANTYQEAVKWLLDHTPETGQYPIDQEVVFEHVERMKQVGWDAKTILRKCARFDIYNIPGHLQIPLNQIVYFDHPVLHELEDEEVRIALYRMAAVQVGNYEAEQFADRVRPGAGWPSGQLADSKIRSLEKFMALLGEEATPAAGIRNR